MLPGQPPPWQAFFGRVEHPSALETSRVAYPLRLLQRVGLSSLCPSASTPRECSLLSLLSIDTSTNGAFRGSISEAEGGRQERNLSHQTRKFPPTPSIFSTSTRLIRMIKLQYCTLTVITFRGTIPY